MKQSTKDRLEKITIRSGASLMDAFRQMDSEAVRLLLVDRDGSFAGLISAGDIQRAIIANRPLDSALVSVLRPKISVASVDDDFASVRKMMLEVRTEFMPVLDAGGKLVDVVFWEDLFDHDDVPARQIDLPVVVMAGGKGSRLKPFSNVLPKPLFPLGDKTIIEAIMDRFKLAGCGRFFISLNHKADFIRSYFDHLEGDPYAIDFYTEDKPLGTAGSLQLIKDRIDEPFVTNCDIVIDTDYSEIASYHKEHKNEITLVAAVKVISIPYGTVESGEGGQLVDFREKPEINYLVNAGLYLLEPHLLDEIPADEFYNITDLIDSVRERGGSVGVFPVSEKSWCDIGQWEEYRRTLSILGEQA